MGENPQLKQEKVMERHFTEKDKQTTKMYTIKVFTVNHHKNSK